MKKILIDILRKLSKKIISKYQPEVIGITGSVGKTSAKEAIAQILGAKFVIRANHKNYNNEIGLPLTIIGVGKSPGRSIIGWLAVFLLATKLILKRDKNYPRLLILEMGADKPGDIKYLTEIAPCKVGVFTYVSHAHTEFFKTLKKIALEKRVIISHLKSDGFAVLNFDNDLVMAEAGETKAKIITYGFKEGASMRATDVNIMNGADGRPVGLNFKVHYAGNVVPIFLPNIISQNFINASLAGLAVGVTYGINLVDGAAALRAINPLPGHMRVLPGIKNTLVIDDSYNSSPAAAVTALQTLAELNLPTGAKRFAVLGDMLELGPETATAHREIGFKVAELGIDFLITVGEASKDTIVAAVEAGLNVDQTAGFATSAEAGKFLQSKLKEGDIALVKGSQGSRMEKVVKEVMAEPLKAKEMLVRQGEEWLN